MKIGLLTLPFNNNYGGFLQAYALLTVLKSMGHDVELINRRPQTWSMWRCIKYMIKNTGLMILGKPHRGFIPRPEDELKNDGQLMMRFVNNYIVPRTEPIYSSKVMRNVITGRYDVVVVGSDQVWRPEYVPNISEFFFSFLPDDSTRRIAYAASFGTSAPCYTKHNQIICGKNFEKFHAVSFREKSGVDVIASLEWHNMAKTVVVLDPTMLLNSNDYDMLLADVISKCRNKVFCYVLDDSNNVCRIINQVSQALNKDVCLFYGQNKWKNQRHVLPSIEDWLCNLRDSQFVVTDSFHGAVFSIIYHKPFVVYINKRRGADRILSLLEKFRLSDRIISDSGTVISVIRHQIDWETVDEIWHNEYKKSIKYLEESLLV